MKKVLLGILILILLVAGVVWYIGPLNIFIWLGAPNHEFSESGKVGAPDYSLVKNWAALPTLENPSDFRPTGISEDTLLQQIDVFFIHPTGYLKGKYWNSHMEMQSITEQNTQWMLANQASVFSDCNVYAPRYREASLFSFFQIETENAQSALEFAYDDIERAFDYYIANYNNQRPFIVASHSQGSYHGIRLLERKIDNTTLAKRMIAAYLVGMYDVSNEKADALKTIEVCDRPDQFNCLMHWATFAVGSPIEKDWDDKMVCVNPLTWKRNGNKAGQEQHKGFVPSSGEFAIKLYGSDAAEIKVPISLVAPKIAHTSAECRNGRLIVEKQDIPSMELTNGNYHGLDYQLFHMDIRQNVHTRAQAYLNQKD